MEEFMDFEKFLVRKDCATTTVNSYLADMEHFARWFKQTNGEELAPDRLTPTDVKQYKQFLARFKIVQKGVTAPLQIMEGTVAGYKRSSPGRAGKNVSR